jgi:anthranilate synthase component 2
MRVFVLDNYDSYTYNLVQYLGELGAEPLVRRNDEIAIAEVEALAPHAVLISPGPGVPADAGISVPLIQALAGRVPLLGVCLGHQALAEAFGGRVVRAPRLMHGKTSRVAHDGRGVFRGLPSPFTAMRYHSLIVDETTVPAELEVTARTADDGFAPEIMGLTHRSASAWGVQFHPESIGTEVGKRLVKNFLERASG